MKLGCSCACLTGCSLRGAHERCSGLLRGVTIFGEYGYALDPWMATTWLRLLERLLLPMATATCDSTGASGRSVEIFQDLQLTPIAPSRQLPGRLSCGKVCTAGP